MSEATTTQEYNNAPIDSSIEDGFHHDDIPQRDQDPLDDGYNENYQHGDDDDNDANNDDYSDDEGYGGESTLVDGRTIFTRPDQEVEGRKLFIGNLDFKITTAELKEYFSKFGEVEDAVVMNSKSESGQNQSRGFGFVVFKDKSVATNVANDDKLEINGTLITANFARPRANQNITRLFVGSIPSTLTEQIFIEYFEKYGKVENVQISPSRNNPSGDNNIAFITFADSEAAQAALKDIHHTIGGVPLRVSIAKEKSLPRSKSSRGRGGRSSRDHDRRSSRYRDSHRERRDGHRDRDYREPSRRYRDERPSQYRGREPRDYPRRERDPRTPDPRGPREREYDAAPVRYDLRDEVRPHFSVSSERYHESNYERGAPYRDSIPSDRYRDSTPSDRYRGTESRFAYSSDNKYYDDRFDSYSSRQLSSRGPSTAPHSSAPYTSGYGSSSSYHPSSPSYSSSYPQEGRGGQRYDYADNESGSYSSSRSNDNYMSNYSSYQPYPSSGGGSSSTSQSHYSSEYRGGR